MTPTVLLIIVGVAFVVVVAILVARSGDDR